MTSPFYIHRTIAFFVNVFMVGLIIYFVIKTNSDKSPIIFMVFYPLLTLVNLIISVALWGFKSTKAKIYEHTIIALVVIFLPLIVIVSQL